MVPYKVVCVCVSHTAGCGVPDTTPAPEIMYKHAQGAQKGLTATKKKKKKVVMRSRSLFGGSRSPHFSSASYCYESKHIHIFFVSLIIYPLVKFSSFMDKKIKLLLVIKSC